MATKQKPFRRMVESRFDSRNLYCIRTAIVAATRLPPLRRTADSEKPMPKL